MGFWAVAPLLVEELLHKESKTLLLASYGAN
jgi:hypothetical protein